MSMSNVSTNAKDFQPGRSGNPKGRPTKVATLLRNAQLKLIRDLETRALAGDAAARDALFDLITRSAAR